MLATHTHNRCDKISLRRHSCYVNLALLHWHWYEVVGLNTISFLFYAQTRSWFGVVCHLLSWLYLYLGGRCWYIWSRSWLSRSWYWLGRRKTPGSHIECNLKEENHTVKFLHYNHRLLSVQKMVFMNVSIKILNTSVVLVSGFLFYSIRSHVTIPTSKCFRDIKFVVSCEVQSWQPQW